MDSLYREQFRLENFLNKEGEYRLETKESVVSLTKTKGWEILEAYITHLVQESALSNMREFENNAVSENPDPNLALRQTFQSGVIRGCGLVLNFPAFVENHFKFNHKEEKGVENGRSE